MDIADRLDQLLDLPTRSREGWLQQLAAQDAALAARLRGLLARAAQADDAGFLGQPAAFTEAPGGAADSAHAPGQILGPWRLLRPLGAGGMAEVWLAERATGDYERQVALKLTHAGGAALRFGRERDVMAQLSHPGIARLYDAGVDAGQAWIAMEYIDGRPLLDACAGLSVRARVALLLELAEAVQHAHAQLVVHRDIKPGNVLIDASGHPRLLDFGIARLLDERGAALTRVGASPLTLEFAAPEQLRGEIVGVACDVYALGVLGRVMLTGRNPWAAWRSDTKALMAAILEGRMGPPSHDADDVGTARALRGDLDAILLRATALEPAVRYASAQALADDLRRWLDHRPVHARGRARGYVIRRWAYRHRWAVTAGSAVLLALTVGLSLALWQAQRAAEEARVASATERFLVELFQANSLDQVDPAQAQQVTAAALLERGSQRIAADLQDAPATRLRLLDTLIGLNRDLALVDQVQALQAQRLALWRQLHGKDAAGLARVLIDAARAAAASNTHVADAPALADEAERRLADAGPRADAALPGLLALARAEIAGDDQCTAVRHAREAVDRLRPVRAAEPAWLEALLAAAMAEAYCGDGRVAVQRAEEGLALAQSLKRLPAVEAAYTAKAMAHSRLGQPGQAVATAELACQTAQSKHPVDAVPGTDVLNACAYVTGLLRDFGHWARAAELAAQLVQRLPSRPQDPDAAATLWIDLARAQRLMGDLAAAQASIDTAGRLLDTFEAEPGQRVMWLDARADIASARGQTALADSIFQQAYALHEQQHHVGTAMLLPHLARRVMHAARAGRVAEARRWLDAFDVRDPGPQGSSRRHVERQTLVAAVALAARDTGQAASVAAEAVAEARRFAEPEHIHDLLATSLELQSQALRAGGRAAEAQALKAELDSLRTALMSR